MPKQSTGILPYRWKDGNLEVFLVHPGGPFWAKKDQGAWSIPKGEFDLEDGLTAARREFLEETGLTIDGEFIELSPRKIKSGKLIYAWAAEKDIDIGAIVSNEFEMEWPPRSGRRQMFPEVDRAGWFDPNTALEKINPGQAGFIQELTGKLGVQFKAD